MFGGAQDGMFCVAFVCVCMCARVYPSLARARALSLTPARSLALPRSLRGACVQACSCSRRMQAAALPHASSCSKRILQSVTSVCLFSLSLQLSNLSLQSVPCPSSTSPLSLPCRALKSNHSLSSLPTAHRGGWLANLPATQSQTKREQNKTGGWPTATRMPFAFRASSSEGISATVLGFRV